MRYLVLVALLAGCAHQQAQTRADELGGYVEPLIGQPSRAVVEVLGPPSEVQSVGGYEVWRWRQTVGTRSKTVGGANYVPGYNLAAGFGRTRTRVQYDEVVCYFENDRLVRYNAYAQR